MRDIIHHGLRMKGFCLSFFTLTGLFYGWRARGQKFLRRGYSSHSKVFNANKWKNREIIPQSMSNRNGNSVDGIDLLPVETIIEIQKIAKLLFRRCFAAVVVDGLPWVQEIFSRVRRGASWAAGRHVFSLRPKTRAAKLREKTFRAGDFLRLDRSRKPRMKSLWHPGYRSLRKHPFLLALRHRGRFAKRPHRRRASRNGFFRRLRVSMVRDGRNI